MYIGGKNVAREYLQNNQPINKIIISEDLNDQTVISLIEKKKIPTEIWKKKQLDQLVKDHHQGIILDIPDFKYCTLKELLQQNEFPFFVILDHLEDPHNFGAIIRTAEAAGVNGIIIPKDRSVQVTGTVFKTSAGAISNMPICQVANLTDAIQKLKKAGVWIVGTDMGKQSYTEVDYNMPIALVVGNEGKGMSHLIEQNCDFVVSLPMIGKVNSLNASVATGIMIYKILENRK